MKEYSEELVEYIENNRMKYNVNTLCEKIEKKFNKNITPKALRKYYYRHNLDYKKINKFGYKQSVIAKPIGYESNPDKNGLIRVKINDKQWVYKQRYIYEKHHGKIPKGYKVIFLNSDKTDYRIENLAIVKENVAPTLYGLKLNSKNSDVTKLGVSVAELISETRKIKKSI